MNRIRTVVALFLLAACTSTETKAPDALPPMVQFEAKGFPEPGRSEYVATCTKGRTVTFCLCAEHYAIEVWGNIETMATAASTEDVMAIVEVCMPFNANHVEEQHAD